MRMQEESGSSAKRRVPTAECHARQCRSSVGEAVRHEIIIGSKKHKEFEATLKHYREDRRGYLMKLSRNEAMKKRKRRLRRISKAQMHVENSLLELRKFVPSVADDGFNHFYYLLRLAKAQKRAAPFPMPLQIAADSVPTRRCPRS